MYNINMTKTILSKSPHLAKCYETWARLQQQKAAGRFELDGDNLHIADVVAVADHGCVPQLSTRPDVVQGMRDSVEVLMDHLAKGYYVYGVNTGFGGSADTRTNEVVKLQASLMQLTQAGILSAAPHGSVPEQAMPAPWVRATIVVRCNSTLRGHSAVSLPVLQALTRLLEHGIDPIVPLRGSVSASGDLMPLAYITGAIEGNPDILVQGKDGLVLPAPEALRAAGLSPVTLGPKEGLGLVNGTASSAALGALVMSHAHKLAALTQALTAMAVEALHGFHPFIAQVRPHRGQVECAHNIASFLRNSHLARDVHKPKDRRREDLVQDRYSLRSAPQWLGPQLEDLLLAEEQISTELNSSRDNPLVDVANNDIPYGCNFQAASVAAAMEKTRLALQMMGRLLFAQMTEMADPMLSGGLPSSLAADDPSLSFTFKGVEIGMAAYMAELSYLAGPMTSHVQAAEMHNQSVNSMAFASGRLSMQAINILTMMCTYSLYAGCQALDLRALHMAFKRKATRVLASVTESHFAAIMDTADLDCLQGAIELHVASSWDGTAKHDLGHRCSLLAETAISHLVNHITGPTAMSAIREWQTQSSKALYAAWVSTFDAFCQSQHTSELLGRGSGVLYRFVREELGVPFHQGFVEHPTTADAELAGRAKRTVGGWISMIHDAIREGAVHSQLMELVKTEDPHALSDGDVTVSAGLYNGYPATNGNY